MQTLQIFLPYADENIFFNKVLAYQLSLKFSATSVILYLLCLRLCAEHPAMSMALCLAWMLSER